MVREAPVPPRRDLGLLDRRRERRLRLYDGGHGRGDELIATGQRTEPSSSRRRSSDTPKGGGLRSNTRTDGASTAVPTRPHV